MARASASKKGSTNCISCRRPQQIDNRYAARCLVELADDRLWRATRQEGGEPGWRFKIRKPLLMSTGQIWQGRVHSRPRGHDFVVVSFFEGETDGFETN